MAILGRFSAIPVFNLSKSIAQYSAVMVFPFSRYSMGRIHFPSQKTDAIPFPTDGTHFAFFGASLPRAVHCLDCCFVSGAQWRISVSSMVTNCHKKSYGFFLNTWKQSADVDMRCRFCSEVSRRVTNLAQTFFICNSLCKNKYNCTVEMPSVSANSRNFIRLSS